MKNFDIMKATPTDNPIITALNRWMKEELYPDFELASAENVPLLSGKCVHYFNNKRAAAALSYRSPVQRKGAWPIIHYYIQAERLLGFESSLPTLLQEHKAPERCAFRCFY
jgi:hypothetical protein